MFKIRQAVMVILLLAQGIFETLEESSDFTQLEERVHTLTQKAAGMLLTFALEEIDRQLLAKKDKTLQVVGTRERVLVTSVGGFKLRCL